MRSTSARSFIAAFFIGLGVLWASPGEALAVVPESMRPVLAEARSYWERYLPPRVVRLKVAAIEAYYHAPEPRSSSRIMKAIDATEFLPELETMLVPKNGLGANARLAIRRILVRAKLTGRLSYHDMLVAISCFSNNQALVIPTLTQLEKFPLSVLYAAVAPHSIDDVAIGFALEAFPIEIDTRTKRVDTQTMTPSQNAAHDTVHAASGDGVHRTLEWNDSAIRRGLEIEVSRGRVVDGLSKGPGLQSEFERASFYWNMHELRSHNEFLAEMVPLLDSNTHQLLVRYFFFQSPEARRFAVNGILENEAALPELAKQLAKKWAPEDQETHLARLTKALGDSSDAMRTLLLSIAKTGQIRQVRIEGELLAVLRSPSPVARAFARALVPVACSANRCEEAELLAILNAAPRSIRSDIERAFDELDFGIVMSFRQEALDKLKGLTVKGRNWEAEQQLIDLDGLPHRGRADNLLEVARTTPHESVREIAIQKLGSMKTRKATRHLFVLAENHSSALLELGLQGGSLKTIPFLKTKLDSPDPAYAKAAVLALAEATASQGFVGRTLSCLQNLLRKWRSGAK